MTNLTFGKHEVWINSHEVPSATLDVTTEVIDVTPLMKVEPDPRWTYVDARGHFHAFDHEGELPTLKVENIPHRSEPDPDDEYDEPYEWNERIFKCRICDDVIEPRYTESQSTWKETAPGRTSWEVEARWPDDVLLPTPSEIVSIRIKTTDREWFGLGMVTDRQMRPAERLGIAYPLVSISGLGKLAYRKST